MAVTGKSQTGPRAAGFPPGLSFSGYAAYRAMGHRGAFLPNDRRPALAAQALRVLASAPGVALRGTYDTSGYRGEAQLLLWLAAPGPDQLQDALADFLKTPMGGALEPYWMGIGVHRPSGLTKSHVPAYFRGEPARRYLCLQPLTQSADWHLLDPQARQRQVAEEGRLLRQHPNVRTSTVSAFGTGDYDWLIAYEGDELTDIVDLQQGLRSAEMRRHTIGQAPVLMGVRKPLAKILESLP